MRIGIDIGGTTTEGVLLGDSGGVVASLSVPTPQGPAVSDAVLRVTRELRAQAVAGTVHSIGIGIPGLVEPASGIVRGALNLGIRTLALGAQVHDATGLVVRVDNDVKATALGAAAVLGAGGRSLSYLNLGTGVAAAAVENGVVLRGAQNSAGEIGHVMVRDDGPPCACGARGCVEAYLGGRALGLRLASLGPGIGVAELFADDRPSAALRAERDAAARALATAIRVMGLLYGSETIVLGGGVIRHAAGLVPAAAAILEDAARTSSFLRGLGLQERLTTVPTGAPIAAIGAAALCDDALAHEGAR